MATDITIPRTRRALLGAGLGALAATVAGAIGRPASTKAADGDAILLGRGQVAESATWVSTGANVTFYGTNNTNVGIGGISTTGTGTLGESASGTGVHGVHNYASTGTSYAAAVLAEANTTTGVACLGNNYATSGRAIGAQGTTDSPTGLASIGWARAGGLGVAGYSGAVFPSTPTKTGVFGASAAGRGGVFQGKVAQLRLSPSGASTHPSSGARGDLFVDKHGRLWFCKGSTTWKQIA